MIKELAQTDDHIMSFTASGNERVSTGYTFSTDLCKYDYHIELIRMNLSTNRVSSFLPEILSEVTLAFEENTSIGPGMCWRWGCWGCWGNSG